MLPSATTPCHTAVREMAFQTIVLIEAIEALQARVGRPRPVARR